MNKKFLIIAAHPDDEILGCGATAAKLVDNGWEGQIVIMSQGGMARGESFSAMMAEVKKNAITANKIVGITNLTWFDLPDNAFDSLPILEITKKIETLIKDFSPRIIFTHYHGDLNVDHRKVFEAVMISCRPQPGFCNPDIYSFFIASSSDWGDGTYFKQFSPNAFCNVEKTIGVKLEALKCYKTEMRDKPHSRSIESVETFSRYWGNRVGYYYVEPFDHVRSFILRDDKFGNK